MVAILDGGDRVVGVVDVAGVLEEEQHLHPHDAVFLENGDMVVVTWSPGRLSYWKLLEDEEGDEEEKNIWMDWREAVA